MQSRFAENLRSLRKAKGLSQDAVSQALDIPTSNIRRYEATNDIPSRHRLKIIANFFAVTVDQILGYEEIESTNKIDITFINDYLSLSHEDRELVKLLVKSLAEKVQ